METSPVTVISCELDELSLIYGRELLINNVVLSSDSNAAVGGVKSPSYIAVPFTYLKSRIYAFAAASVIAWEMPSLTAQQE